MTFQSQADDRDRQPTAYDTKAERKKAFENLKAEFRQLLQKRDSITGDKAITGPDFDSPRSFHFPFGGASYNFKRGGGCIDVHVSSDQGSWSLHLGPNSAYHVDVRVNGSSIYQSADKITMLFPMHGLQDPASDYDQSQVAPFEFKFEPTAFKTIMNKVEVLKSALSHEILQAEERRSSRAGASASTADLIHQFKHL